MLLSLSLKGSSCLAGGSSFALSYSISPCISLIFAISLFFMASSRLIKPLAISNWPTSLSLMNRIPTPLDMKLVFRPSGCLISGSHGDPSWLVSKWAPCRDKVDTSYGCSMEGLLWEKQDSSWAHLASNSFLSSPIELIRVATSNRSQSPALFCFSIEQGDRLFAWLKSLRLA